MKFAFMMYGKRYSWQQVAAQILVLPGIYLLCVRGGLSGFGIGEVIALAAAVLMAATLVLSGKYLEEVDPVSLTALQGGCSAVLALIGCIIFEGRVDMSAADTKVWAIIL